jgi:lysophospholipase L1-like esterase
MPTWEQQRRFAPNERWAGVMRTELGEGFWVVEEGLNGRTTVWDDPIEGSHKNGKTHLLPILESHAPLDLVIIMLGTNDLKRRFAHSAYDIACGVDTLVDIIMRSQVGHGSGVPKVLMLCPPPVTQLTLFAEMFAGAPEKSQQLARHYRQIAKEKNCAFFNTAEVISCSDDDGIHFEVEAHIKLGKTVTGIVRTLLETGGEKLS